ncbi:MAG: hypothetical protein WC635_13195 [Bacteriovorax sp.]|jgi:hypothetical protein
MQAYKLILKLLALLIVASCSKGEFDKVFLSEGVSLSFANRYKLTSKTEDPFVVVGKSEDGNSLLKIHLIKVQDKAEAIQKIKSQLKIKMISYNITAVPYPGQMSITSKCDSSFLPQLQKGSGFSYLSYLAGERLTSVICQGEEVTYKAGTAFYLDKSYHRILSVEFYIKKQYGIMDINDFFIKNFKDLEIVQIDLL